MVSFGFYRLALRVIKLVSVRSRGALKKQHSWDGDIDGVGGCEHK